MFKFLFRRDPAAGRTAEPVIEDDDIPRYPPFAKGLPAAATKRILQTQSELIARIKATLRFSGAEFEEIVIPVIERYAAYVHLLPASEAHHHRGAGGLFRHGLEVGLWAAQRAESHFFCVGDTQKNQRDNETRWQYAAFLGGLLHDVGKPLSDVAVTDKTGKKEWNPYDSSLGDWLHVESIERYFLRWRDKRNKRHEKFSMMNLDQIIVPKAKSYLNKPGPYIMEALLESIVGTGASEALTQLVLWADQESVKRDLSNQRLEVDEYSYGVPVERFIFDALRRLVLIAKINVPGATIWRLEQGVFLSWQATVQDIHSILDKDKVPGVPRSPDTLADILIERGFAIPYQERPDKKPVRYWRIYPDALKGVPLLCVRIDDIELIFTNEPPPPVKASFSPPLKTANNGRDPGSNLPANPGADVHGVPTNPERRMTDSPPTPDLVSWDEVDAQAAADQLLSTSDVDGESPIMVSDANIKAMGITNDTSTTPSRREKTNPDRREGNKDVPVATPRASDDVLQRRVPQSPGWGLIQSAILKTKEGIPTFELLPDGSYGIPYPASAQLLGQPRDVMNILAEEGMLRIEQTSSSKTLAIAGKKYLVFGRELSKFVKAALHDEPTEFFTASSNENKQKVENKEKSRQMSNARVAAKAEASDVANGTIDTNQSAPAYNQESFNEDFTQQIIQGFGAYIVGDVDTQITETATVFRISTGCVSRISELIQQNQTVVKMMIRKVPGIRMETNRGTDDYIELVQ